MDNSYLKLIKELIAYISLKTLYLFGIKGPSRSKIRLVIIKGVYFIYWTIATLLAIFIVALINAYATRLIEN